MQFSASGTSKEDVKTAIRGPSNKDTPDYVKQGICQMLDAIPLTAGHTMRVELNSEVPDEESTRREFTIKISTEADSDARKN